MPKKKIAQQEPVIAVEAAQAVAPKKAKAVEVAAKPARAPRASAKAVTHKHKKATMAVTPAEPVAVVVPVTAPVAEPTYDQISKLAYSYWEARGYQGGSEYDDWLRAVNELQAR